MDWTTFYGTVAILLIAVIPMMAFPKASQKVITDINEAVSNSLGAVYLSLGLIVLGFVLYIAFGKYGNVTLGRASDKPEFGNFTWAAMLFCAGIGSDILYWGVIEWAFYFQVPPHGEKGMTDAALEYATMYGMFHWGPIAWAIYVLPALPIGYLVFVKKKPVYKISQACRPILKGQTEKLPGKIVDILFIFGLLGGAATSLGLGVPMISAGIERLTGIDGRKETNFPQQWTIFYWSWWIVYAPFIGLFIARISKGRTLKEVILGTIIYGTLGCVLFFGIFGNYAVYLQITHQFDVVSFLNAHGTEAAIVEVIHQLPFHNIIVVLFLISAFLFLATTFDSGSYILASASQKKVIGEPLRANRLFWAFALCLLPFSLMLVGGQRALDVLKTASILASVPLIVIFVFMMISFIITLSRDRVKLQLRAARLREAEHRSLKINQIAEEREEEQHAQRS
ncbi:BCCT family transporter [Staphylococcus simulans]|uniref:BCCT family transporter n=1 Tax=Staphylococcus simulans TaxID=1286 RepID=UPI001BD0AFE8|nr:BCCT family transporter [Staphylococcus simulans]